MASTCPQNWILLIFVVATHPSHPTFTSISLRQTNLNSIPYIHHLPSTYGLSIQNDFLGAQYRLLALNLPALRFHCEVTTFRTLPLNFDVLTLNYIFYFLSSSPRQKKAYIFHLILTRLHDTSLYSGSKTPTFYISHFRLSLIKATMCSLPIRHDGRETGGDCILLQISNPEVSRRFSSKSIGSHQLLFKGEGYGATYVYNPNYSLIVVLSTYLLLFYQIISSTFVIYSIFTSSTHLIYQPALQVEHTALTLVFSSTYTV